MLKIKAIILLLLPIHLVAQSAYQEVREGNELFKNNSFVEAESKYRESLRKEADQVEAAFNLGDALYRQGKFEDAGRYFQRAAEKAELKEKKAQAYHNLGNSLVKSKKLEEGINAYKKALINNPKDEESRYNLAYAQRQLQQQQQQQEQKDEEKKDDKKDEKKEDENQDKDKNKEEEEEQKDQEEQQEEEEQQKKEEEQKQQQEQEKQVSREDAERILEAINNKEKELQEKLKKEKIKNVNVDIEKDW